VFLVLADWQDNVIVLVRRCEQREQCIVPFQRRCPARLVERQMRIAQHECIFLATVGAGHGLQAAAGERIQQRLITAVAEHEQVQAYICIDYHPIRYHCHHFVFWMYSCCSYFRPPSPWIMTLLSLPPAIRCLILSTMQPN